MPVGRARVVVRHLEVAIRPSRLGGPTGVGNQTVKVLFKMGELNSPVPLSIGVGSMPEPTMVTEHPEGDQPIL